MKCDGCQIECDRAEVFQRHTRFFGADRSLCPACFQNKDHKAHIFWIWVYLIFGVLALPAIFYSPTRILGILMLNVFVFQLFLFISTVLHELGHAIAGRSCGMRVFGIEIGKGRIVYEFHVKHLRWCVRAIPFGGVTYGVSHSARLFQIKQFFYILGGPLVNGIIFFVALKLRPLDGLPTGTSFEGFLPVLLLKWSNALLLIYSLVPHFSNSVAGKIPNDGLWLFWKIWGIKKEQVEENLAARYLYEAGECRLQKNLVGAQKWVDEGIKHFPDNIRLKMSVAGMLYLNEKYAEAIRAFALMVGRHKKHENLDGFLLNDIAYTCVLINRPTLLARADAASRIALKQMPWVVQMKGTRGSVLVELGRYDEALALLHDAMRNHPDKYGQALSACYIGIAESRRGNISNCKNYFSIARKLDPDCVLLDREPK